MKLREYLDDEGIRYKSFAMKMGICEPTLQKIMKPGYNPRIDIVNKIERLTHGKVKYKDWLEGIQEKFMGEIHENLINEREQKM
jgi:predicted transcriptional regulator